ncbi:hypothetical protein A8C56_18630 [Niabella ginsenosidivorans]|uniref:Cyanophycinase n=1 Tax=Niabella ginsenosidivorans TaxID=1176587 RepID=A0A1A9I7P7_9BACT|nr:cyanophycinase [Niabella ginsenosidivorans]ANH82721.1 hypothetical protein A8C56_18630 [Niabella ginsenosidivorans]
MMKHLFPFIIILTCWHTLACGKDSSTGSPNPPPAGGGAQTPQRPGSLGLVGDTADVIKSTGGGMVLMGGGTDVDAAFKWMIDRSGGGDVVIIRASGTDAYNPYVYKLGAVNSVETLLINSRELADNDAIARIIRNAEMLFIAGGDQSKYREYWKGTKTEAAINYLLNEKKTPVGGTSAGCAILGNLYYSGETGGVTSEEALNNPYNVNITLYNSDFIQSGQLKNVITDQHFLTRSREGRTMTFLGRIMKDWSVAAKGIAVDERTAVCIDKEGTAKIFGSSKAYFLLTDSSKKPEQFQVGQKVTWSDNEKAVRVYEITGSNSGAGSVNTVSFDVDSFSGGTWYYWYIANGVLFKKQL